MLSLCVMPMMAAPGRRLNARQEVVRCGDVAYPDWHPIPAGSIQDIKWRDVRVGHILKVEDEELFPADMLCLYSALDDDACFIKTTNLDGESNLKIRRPLDLRDAAPEEDADVLDIRATLECEQPNANLHKFQGRLIYQSGGEGRPPGWPCC